MLSGRSLRRADHSYRGVLPTVVRRCVWSRNRKNEEDMARVGAAAPQETNGARSFLSKEMLGRIIQHKYLSFEVKNNRTVQYESIN